MIFDAISKWYEKRFEGGTLEGGMEDLWRVIVIVWGLLDLEGVWIGSCKGRRDSRAAGQSVERVGLASF